MSFTIKNDMCLDKYNEIWNMVKKKLNIKFHNLLVFYGEKCIKTKARDFNGVIKTNFLGDELPKEIVHYACIACISIDSVMRMKKIELSTRLFKRTQVQSKEKKMSKFKNIKIQSESELKSESEFESDTELESELESESD